MNWGTVPWAEAYRLPGARQVGLAKHFLARYPWWRFEPHPEWSTGRWSESCSTCHSPVAGTTSRWPRGFPASSA